MSKCEPTAPTAPSTFAKINCFAAPENSGRTWFKAALNSLASAIFENALLKPGVTASASKTGPLCNCPSTNVPKAAACTGSSPRPPFSIEAVGSRKSTVMIRVLGSSRSVLGSIPKDRSVSNRNDDVFPSNESRSPTDKLPALTNV